MFYSELLVKEFLCFLYFGLFVIFHLVLFIYIYIILYVVFSLFMSFMFSFFFVSVCFTQGLVIKASCQLACGILATDPKVSPPTKIKARVKFLLGIKLPL